MSIFFEIIGWIILLIAAWFSFYLGQAIFSSGELVKRNVEVVMPGWTNYLSPVIATLLQIFIIKNVWLAIVICSVIGVILGYIAERTYWRLGYARPRSSSQAGQGQLSFEMTGVHQTAVIDLLSACSEVKIWMRDDPSPSMRRIREIGETLNAQGGKRLMQEVHAAFVQNGGAQWSRALEMMWHGIGTWQG